jgi:hypothetical protein
MTTDIMVFKSEIDMPLTSDSQALLAHYLPWHKTLSLHALARTILELANTPDYQITKFLTHDNIDYIKSLKPVLVALNQRQAIGTDLRRVLITYFEALLYIERFYNNSMVTTLPSFYKARTLVVTFNTYFTIPGLSNCNNITISNGFFNGTINNFGSVITIQGSVITIQGTDSILQQESIRKDRIAWNTFFKHVFSLRDHWHIVTKPDGKNLINRDNGKTILVSHGKYIAGLRPQGSAICFYFEGCVQTRILDYIRPNVVNNAAVVVSQGPII